MIIPRLLLPILALAVCGCDSSTVKPTQPLNSSVMSAEFGKMPDGQPVEIFTLTNNSGTEAKITEYGAILVSLKVADRDGKLADITHGYDDLAGWLTNTSYFGASVGRFGRRYV